MGTSRQMPHDIREALLRGELVITGNQRAARTLRRLHDEAQRDTGATSWQPPNILAWDTWTASLWHQLVLSGEATSLLLSPTQEISVWRSIIVADAELRTLRQPDALASLAAGAWRILHAHRHTGPLTGPPESTDETAYRRWSSTFRARCRRERLLTSAELEASLRDAITSGHVSLSFPGLLLTGFDQHTPAQKHLLDSIANTGRPVSHPQPDLEVHSRHAFSANEKANELLACAHWIRHQLADQPESRLAIIVPALETERATLERTLRDVLAPELHNIELRTGLRPYEFSLGGPLSHTASVAAALDLLHWTTHDLPSSAVSRLLLSRYLAGSSYPAERLARASFDATRLKQTKALRPELSRSDLLIQAYTTSASIAGLRSTLRAFHLACAPIEDATDRAYLDWSERIRSVLTAAEWTPSGESSLEHQIRQRWESCLDDLATLDFTGTPVSFPRALEDLRRIVSETIFAPESHNAPIQILGPLEAAGSTFDSLWLLRCGDLTFPSSPAVNTLIPWHVRRSLDLPGSNPALDAERTDRLVTRLLTSASDVVVSYAAHLDQGRQRLAPAVAKLHLPELHSTVLPSLSAAIDPPPLTLEAVADHLPIPPPPDRVLEGGASLLEAQAACGFRAFALHRLSSRPLEEASFGLDARARGIIIHNVLQLFWEDVKTQDALRSMSSADRAVCLTKHIHTAFDAWSGSAQIPWESAYLEIQRTRLLRILTHWLDQELKRSPFEVLSLERSYKELTVGPLRLGVRVDRIDRTSAGAVLIDYKTGISKHTAWLTDRPDAPQLPLYTMLPEAQTLDAVAFATIRPGKEMRFSGYESRKGVLPDAAKLQAESLELQQAAWRDILERLAAEFHAGDTRVQPKNYPGTCTFCAQRLLCRLDANTLVEEIEDEMEEVDSARG